MPWLSAFFILGLLPFLSCSEGGQKKTKGVVVNGAAKKIIMGSKGIFDPMKSEYWTALSDSLELSPGMIDSLRVIEDGVRAQRKSLFENVSDKAERKTKLKSINEQRRKDVTALIGEENLQKKNNFDRRWAKSRRSKAKK